MLHILWLTLKGNTSIVCVHYMLHKYHVYKYYMWEYNLPANNKPHYTPVRNDYVYRISEIIQILWIISGCWMIIMDAEFTMARFSLTTNTSTYLPFISPSQIPTALRSAFKPYQVPQTLSFLLNLPGPTPSSPSPVTDHSFTFCTIDIRSYRSRSHWAKRSGYSILGLARPHGYILKAGNIFKAVWVV